MVIEEGSGLGVGVLDVHGVAPALCVGQPQEQRVQGLVELLWGLETSGSGRGITNAVSK